MEINIPSSSPLDDLLTKLQGFGGKYIPPKPNGSDYDLAGYIAKYGIPDQSKGQHLTDEYKLPNHPTFSNESIYSNPEMQGGKWVQGGNTQFMFEPSKQNINNLGLDGLTNYFQRHENKGTNLQLPNGKVIYGGIFNGLFK